MLSTLKIENIAIIDSLEIDFSKGLNVLTGETGAGKSIILNSISLLSGKRTNNSIIRNGTDKAKVEAIFIIPESIQNELRQTFEELEDAIDSEELILKRIIDQSGRNKYYVNSSLVPLGTASQIAKHLFEITTQHEQQTLLSPGSYREIIDNFGVPRELLASVASRYSEWHNLDSRLKTLSSSKQEQLIRIERLKLEYEELKSSCPKKGEKNEILDEIGKLQHFEKIQNSLSQFISIFEGSEFSERSTESLESNLSEAANHLESAKNYDNSINSIFELFELGMTQLLDAKMEISSYLHSFNFDPEHFEMLQGRLSEIKQLERKYKREDESLISYFHEIEKEISEFDGGAFDEDKLKKLCEEKKFELSTLEKELTNIRKQVSEKLAKEILKGLKEIQMNKAKFEISITAADSSRNGADHVQFMFSANPGEPLRALDKVASGGELSRILLILKSSHKASNSTLLHVFDEIDSGVSGAVAQIVGEKLCSISKNSQVLCITHAAQVAALADAHFLVSKEVSSGRTYSKIKNLNENERTNIIASMLAGKEVSKEFLLSAKELMKAK